ncbi:DUF4363 family protein [Desulfosporosinus fructosivorans]|uniref:DUF4363 family protein n=1 Tax=Desulfosporosinus fructosivorans TaxID=2018669 RepID=A0A4Z0R917_9FIRM|nr:DUF4363 family protein [Desulfosporosinus fructosivorans]TGE39681.1 DUF4363 family protein [Desulfosporosinus fructosivorans]
MRTIITIVTIVIILCGGSFASYQYITTATGTMGTLLESVENSITVEKWEKADEELNITQKKWEDNNMWWSILLDHQAIDNIDINLKRLEKHIGVQDISESLGELTTLKLLFEQISGAEMFTLENIF